MTVGRTIRRSSGRQGLHPANFWLAAALTMAAAGSAGLVAAAQTPMPLHAPQSVTLRLTDADLPDGFVGMPFNTAVSAVGGSGFYSILVGGQVPPGMAIFRSGGVVDVGGVPTAEGTYNFIVSVADTVVGGSVSRSYSIHVGPQLLRPAQAASTVNVTDAEIFHLADANSVFFPARIVDAEGFHVSDADNVFRPILVTDAEGFKLTDAVSIFGPDKPSDSEAFHFGDTYSVMTSAMISDPEAFHFGDAYVVAAKVGISPATAPAGTYNTAYSQTFTPAGNTGTATFTPTGALPPGLSFTTSTGQIKISGTPTQTGTFPFTIKVVDSGTAGTSTINYSLVINPASQTINIGTIPSVTYGGGNFTLSATGSPSNLTATITSTSALASGSNPFTPVAAGTATFQATQSGNTNYAAATPVNFNVNIAKAGLNVTASNASRTFDQPNPSFGFSFGSFVNGDSSSVVTGTPTLATTATPVSAVSGSPYNIIPALGTLSAANYAFNFIGGSLTVTKAAQTITFYPLANLTHGTTFPLSARSSSGLPVTYTVSGPATITANILSVTGTGPVQITAAQAGNGNYNAATPIVRSFTAQ